MLSLRTFQVLSDPQKISMGGLRFFMQLMTRYDLRRFRSLPPPSQAKSYFDIDPSSMTKYLGQLVKEKILELGPAVISPTYRLTSESRLSAEELETWTQDTAEFRARFDLVPEPVPEDPAQWPAWLAECRVPGRRQ